jgi:maltose alpha-D-glucosyltransferase/alpha-amylase
MATGDKRYFWRNDDPLWYKDAIVYELHVRAFYDSNGDGFGDFPGMMQKLDYIQDLGVDTIWLLPFYPSPLKDDGYVISNYTGIHSAYGTVSSFRDLIREVNYRGPRVITELVLNHTSDQHQWFQRASRAPAVSRWRNFYVWSDTWGKYKEARIIFKDFEPSNWTWDLLAGAYYWHRFYSHQPDLNYDSPFTRQAIMCVINFWLGMGVSGLRLDAVPYLYERDGTNCENLPATHAFLEELRCQVEERFQNRMLLAEANQWPEDTAAYFGEGDECHMAYHFPLMPRMFMAIRMEDRFPIIDILQNTPLIPETCQWALFLRNHDELTLEMVTDEELDYMYRVYACDNQARVNLGIRRLAPLLSNDRKKIELLKGLLFSLPGTPVIYYGDEIGMGNNFYLGDRNGVRTPMQWSADRNAGFSRANPQRLYLPVVIVPEYHYEAINVEAQQSNPDSLLWWTKYLIALRKRFKALSRGSLEFLYPGNRKVLAFVRRYEDETILVVANLSRLAHHASLDLAAFNGKVPVEVFGQAEFPSIGEAAYSFTLSTYAFYWFSLESREPERLDLLTPVKEVLVQALTLAGDWKDLYNRRGRTALETALLSYMRQRRWFGGKVRYIRSGDIPDVIAIHFETSMAHLILFKMEYSEGDPETCLVPVTFALGEKAERVINELPQAVVARLALKGKDGEGEGVIYDALVEPGFRSAILKAMLWRRRFRGEKGEVAASHTRKVFRLLHSSLGEALESALLKGEQSNTSVVYGERFKLKLYRRLEVGISLEVEIGLFLTEKEAFPNAPPVAGALEYQPRERNQPVTLGVLHGYVHNQGDAWDYTLDSLKRYFQKALATLGIEVPQPMGRSLLDICEEGIPLAAIETIGPYLASADLLGQRTAELHLALASATDEPNLVPEPFSVTYQRSLYYGMRRFSLEVLRHLGQRLKRLPDEAKPNAQRVLDLQDTIIGRLQDVTRRKITGMRIRCHGDYHLGQVLHTGNDFVIIDFESEPARHLGERRIKRSPLRDVAGMICSFHYATYTALRARTSAVLRLEDLPVIEEWAHTWYYWVSATLLKSYLELMGDTPILPPNRENVQVLLDAYLLDKAIYEVNYELNNHPDWVGLPLVGILQVLGADDERAAEGAESEAAGTAPIAVKTEKAATGAKAAREKA